MKSYNYEMNGESRNAEFTESMYDSTDSTAGENVHWPKENKRQARLGGVSKLGSNWVGNQSHSLCTAATGYQSDC